MKKDISKKTSKSIKWENPALTNLGAKNQATRGACGGGASFFPVFPCIPGPSANPANCINGGVAGASACGNGTTAV
jgi:hypothetical protein